MTTSIFSRPLHARRGGPRQDRRRGGCGSITACTSSSCFTMLLALDDQQSRDPVGRDGSGHAVHRPARERSTARRRASRRPGSTSSCAASDRPGAVRDPCCSTWPPSACSAPRAARLLWTNLQGVEEPSSSPAVADPRVRVPAGRLRHQGRSRAAAQLAARCACRGADAVPRCCRATAQRRAVRPDALQGADRPRARQPARRPSDDGIRPAVGSGRGVPAVPAAATSSACSPTRRSSTWGIMTFAFGLGGPIATYAGLLHMTVHSLIKSAIFFAVGHAAQKAGTQVMERHPRPPQGQPDLGLGPDARDPWPSSACRPSACSRASF